MVARGLKPAGDEEANIEKASYFGRCPGLFDEKLVFTLEPKVLGGAAGLLGADEFHRSAKESDMIRISSSPPTLLFHRNG